MFSDILLAVDGSEHAARAAEVAGDLATKYDARVFVLHVVDPSEVGSEERHMAEVEHVVEPGQQYPWMREVPHGLQRVLEPADADARRDRILDFLAREIVTRTLDTLHAQGVGPHRVRVVFKNGQPATRIVETIDDEGIDLVVMGSRGLSKLAGALQGSVSSRVTRDAPCPVLTVK